LSFDVNSLKFDQAGLLPAIVQDKASGEVVMLAYMNKTAVEKTLATKETWFWSRSRQELWHKGATSGNVQKVLEVLYDCDRDIEAYASNQDCCLDIIPIIDTVEQRQLVTRRVKAELGAEMDELVSELAEQLKTADKSISIETAQRMAQRAQDIQQRALEYEKMLNVRLTVLRSQLMEFINRTKVVADESQHMVS
jgi:phosphoribosyl-AMP cyclohydrolase